MASKTRKPKTPNSKSPQKRASQTDSYSPKVADSPRARPTNELGRRLRDLCVSWHESVHKWTNLNSLGTNVANKLMNLQLQDHYSDAEGTNSVSVLDETSESASAELQDEIVRTSQELSTILQKMDGIVTKMESLSKNFEAAKELDKMKEATCDQNDGKCIFKTWTVDKYCNTSNKLLAMYRKELTLKEKLFSSFTSTKDRTTLMVYLSLWLHSPYIDRDHDILLESMLVETDLR
ncbi:cyclin-dependent kinase 2-interacting protein [Nematostella vectensis]|uniref:cyclin-dependent kinase 2-interacting protein n=1 Tax=Nematostella vectensis TaxID=45351 RepID=UPI0020773C97|nr:cyclin-dependent kinase 2-interacting protein [Nematostella vectensis]